MRTNPTDMSLERRIFLVLAGLAFGAMGLWMLAGGFAKPIHDYWRTRDQITVPATIESVEWRVRKRRGSTDVLYRYQVDGQVFIGNRVSLFRSTRPFYRPLSKAQEEGKTIPVFIDPKRPEFSVIDREFTWWFVPFPLLFSAGTLFASAMAVKEVVRGMPKRVSYRSNPFARRSRK